MGDTTTTVELAAEYWKLLRAFERAIDLAPESAQQRLSSQKKYSEGRLNQLAEQAGIKILSYDGYDFELNLPVTALNADEIGPDERAVVERTLEPTIMAGSAVVKTGKVFVIPAAKAES